MTEQIKMARSTAFCCSPIWNSWVLRIWVFPKRAKPVIKPCLVLACFGLFTWQGNIQLSLHISFFRIQRSKTLWNTFGWWHSGIQIYNLSHISTYHSLHEYQLRGWLPSTWAGMATEKYWQNYSPEVGLALLHRGGLSCRKKEKRICDFSTAVRLSPELSLVGHGENINGRVDQNGQNVFAFAGEDFWRCPHWPRSPLPGLCFFAMFSVWSPVGMCDKVIGYTIENHILVI